MAALRVAINGFGRIGRAVFRILEEREDVEVVAVNDLADNEALRYLLQYDTVMGPFAHETAIDGDELQTPKGSVRMLNNPRPEELPWDQLAVDVVVESTGVFRRREQLEAHLSAGAKRVLLTVPAKDAIDYTVVLGVNHDGLRPEHQIISNASCTTNCLAPMAAVLHQEFSIEEGVINTVHAYTNDQRLADVPHSDWRRSRAAAENIIPTSTGAAKAVGIVLPELEGRLHGIASRVPVADGSVVDSFLRLGRSVSREEVDQAVEAAAGSERFSGIIQYSTRPLVSTDVIGNSHSSIYDSVFTSVSGGRYLRVLNWYDNEWGYSCRVCDVLARFCEWS
ncbi:MAG: type I glyceraldehyde-3-phosphate dehydrogenase [Pseudomonadota bacterium]